MGSSKQTQKSTQTRSPYKPATGMIDQSISGVQNWMNDPSSKAAFDYTPNAMTSQGIDKLGGASGANQSSAYLSDVLSGKYLNAENPYQADLDASIRASVMPSINSTFSQAGMSGSTAHQGALMQGLTSGLAAPRYQQYQNERGAMGNAAGLLPQVDAQAAQQQIQAGQLREGYDKAQFDEDRTAGLRPYLETQGLLSTYGNMGGTSSGTTTSTSSPSLGQTIAGGAMTGLGLMTGSPRMGMIGQGMGGGYAPNGSLPWQSGYSPWLGYMSGN